jgi:hypothetical protein
MIVAPLANGPIDVRDRALILIGFAGALPHIELVAPDVGEGGHRRRVLRIRRPNRRRGPNGEIRGLPYGLLPDLPGSGVATMD